jgi:hypothetical protein
MQSQHSASSLIYQKLKVTLFWPLLCVHHFWLDCMALHPLIWCCPDIVPQEAVSSEQSLSMSKRALLEELPEYERKFQLHKEQARVYIAVVSDRRSTCSAVDQQLRAQIRAIDAAVKNLNGHTS